MMKSLAILAATLAAAQASQDAGPGLGRLLSISNSTMEEDCKGKGCRRLQDSELDMWKKANKWMKLLDTNRDGFVDWEEFEPQFSVYGWDYRDISNVFFGMNPMYHYGESKFVFEQEGITRYLEVQKMSAKTEAIMKQKEKQANKRDADAKDDDGVRRLDDLEGQMDKEEREDCTEENPDDCHRRLQATIAWDWDSLNAKADAQISAMDTDGDGQISYEEYSAITDYLSLVGGSYLFRQVDMDQDRFLQQNELAYHEGLRRQAGELDTAVKKMTKKKAKNGGRRLDDIYDDTLDQRLAMARKLIDLLDTNNDGKVDEIEFHTQLDDYLHYNSIEYYLMLSSGPGIHETDFEGYMLERKMYNEIHKALNQYKKAQEGV